MSDTNAQQVVLARLLQETNQAFWQELQHRKRWAYSEAFAAVDHDTRILTGQKAAKLLDERFYLCERALHDSAIAAGAASSDQKVPINGWVYTIVRVGTVSLIQSYVQTPDDFTRPAKFREQHAALNGFLRQPQIALGDVSPALFEPSTLAGIVIHGPINKKFDEAAQRVGFLNFCVPSEDYKRWDVKLPVAEILAAFNSVPAEQSQQRDIATPKPIKRDETGSGEPA